MGRRAVQLDEADPKGLVRESYRIEGITPGECRSIFVDWALSLPVGRSTPDALRALIAHYAQPQPDHPMSGVLQDGLAAPGPTGRRGGREARMRAPLALAENCNYLAARRPEGPPPRSMRAQERRHGEGKV